MTLVAKQYMLRVNLRKGGALRARLMSDLKVRPPKEPNASAERRPRSDDNE
jgi:hypothetical protein